MLTVTAIGVLVADSQPAVVICVTQLLVVVPAVVVATVGAVAEPVPVVALVYHLNDTPAAAPVPLLLTDEAKLCVPIFKQ